MRFDAIKTRTRKYYDEKLNAYGPVPNRVDWNSAELQEMRFEQLFKVCDTRRLFTINEFWMWLRRAGLVSMELDVNPGRHKT